MMCREDCQSPMPFAMAQENSPQRLVKSSTSRRVTFGCVTMVQIPRLCSNEGAEDMPCLQSMQLREDGSSSPEDDEDEKAQILEFRAWMERADHRAAQRGLTPRRDVPKPTVLSTPTGSSLWRRRAAEQARLQE
mmetsp:Transcript_13576/g.30929  ORF Transcript_13576/g.30929 Transcript_13576/m.30929 type:complete len:134 (+) Transcript_13576:85-486(+)